MRWIRLHPGSYWRYYEWKRGLAEPELAILPALCSTGGLSVDVGANIGLYSCHLARLSGSVVAFEPLPPLADLLRRAYRSRGARYRLEQVALSETEDTAQLRMPRRQFGYSTIEPANVLEGKVDTSDIICYEVRTRRLDSFGLQNVVFLKIDVEGHEESVLLGALETLKRSRPSVLVEVEEIHKPGAVMAVRDLMTGLGYGAFFLQDGRLHPFSDFDLSVNQDRTHPERYVRNFLFLGEDAVTRVNDLLSHNRKR